jgi:hypothetical protein
MITQNLSVIHTEHLTSMEKKEMLQEWFTAWLASGAYDGASKEIMLRHFFLYCYFEQCIYSGNFSKCAGGK